MDRPWLPNLLRELAEKFGLPRAMLFAQHWGGQYLRIPPAATADHEVAQIMGLEFWQEVVRLEHSRRDGGEPRIVVPKGPDETNRALQARVVALDRDGCTVNEIARQTGLHVRRVHRIKQRVRERALTSAQKSLFADTAPSRRNP